LVSERINLIYGLRVDLRCILTIWWTILFEIVNGIGRKRQSGSGGSKQAAGHQSFIFAACGFNWNVSGDRSTQLRGGTGIFTGRVPFVWVGNNISNPGQNTNLPAHLRSFDLNAMDPEFKWPQIWTTNLAIDKKLPWEMLGTLEAIYGNDLNAVFVRIADLVKPVRMLPDGRPYYGGAGNNELNADFGAGIYVIDNTSEGHNFNATVQLRKSFAGGFNTTAAYSFTQAKSNLRSTEIASVLWSSQPVQGDPNKPEIGFSEFGQQHRIVGSGTYSKTWSNNLATHFGLFLEIAEGNRFAGSGGNRYSFIYSGDVNGDGQPGNDLIYIPRNTSDQSEIIFDDPADAQAFEAFIQQDEYLSSHRGQIAERFGAVNPWYSNIDLRILQDLSLNTGGQKHTFQLSFDILNFANLLNSDWGVRKVASVPATSPLTLVRFNAAGAPVFNFTGPAETYIDDAGLFSRWQMQIGLRYFFE
jgi:hypothetical protein